MAESFEGEIEQLVRRVARELAEEITVLILRRLGIEASSARRLGAVGGSQAAPLRARAGATPSRSKRGPAPAKAARDGARRHRSTAEELAKNQERVGRVVSQSPGLALGEIERASGLP